MQRVDFVIVSSLGVVTDILLDKLPDQKKVFEPRTRFYFHKTAIHNAFRSAPYEVIVINIPHNDIASAAMASISAIRKWNPSNIVSIGISTGIGPQVKVGDIVIPTSIESLSVSHSMAQGSRRRTESIRPSTKLINAVKSFTDKSWTNLLKKPASRSRPIHVHFGSAFSNDKLIVSQEMAKNLPKMSPALIAIDMEASGVGGVASQLGHKPPDFLSIQCVSNMLGRKQQASDHTLSMDVVASFLVGFLQKGQIPPSRAVDKQQTVVVSVPHELLVQEPNIGKDIKSCLAPLLKISEDAVIVKGSSSET